ncbi:hypothetical protein PHYSODRAFT_315810 [Phytophthora sojae]|uniref:DDE Tnp4 domain-containing protein n=1 Tax=Phytophthora sojae (strain P6497) TaxID=1094619 RepID=G4ZKF4_PHYSP|nr:hypothetical protein PHYSODRAFT_315810 [Phytophthora sojae]EGZ15564.1 hypothetical protein PHYSODRAFT_315810 [Phytophthora sojae]|eukprot:XP_009529313.1 hypothetical protein PHYSODRAFT_315810 [Phytophthora sojae]
MRYDAFQQFCGFLVPVLRVYLPYSIVRVEVVLHCTLRWLAGGCFEDISAIASMSVPTFFFVLLACEELDINFPLSEPVMKDQCNSFASISVHASCDHLSRFTSFFIKYPGGTYDIRAFQLLSLHRVCNKLPLGDYLVGDNAYIPT